MRQERKGGLPGKAPLTGGHRQVIPGRQALDRKKRIPCLGLGDPSFKNRKCKKEPLGLVAVYSPWILVESIDIFL